VSTLTALARAQAWSAGTAQPVALVRHVHLAERPLVFVPLALAGEANAPLAAMIGDDPSSPLLLVVSQPRNRDQRFAFTAELADVVVPYIEGFCSTAEEVPAGRDETRLRFTDAPQVVVPNQAAIGFVRLLGRSTRFRRTTGEFAVRPAVPVLGRWLTYLAERTEHPGSCQLLAATEALSRHWASGQSELEDLNLAALLGWIDPPPGMTGAEAAAAAEDPVLSPPAGPATDPGFDNEVLDPLIEACSRADGDSAASARALAALERALEGQLLPAWQQVWRAVELLRALPEGASVARRWESDRDSFTGYAAYLRDTGLPQPRRDGAVAAARRLDWLERAQATYAAQRAFDDPLAMAEYRMTGEAFAGLVVKAEPDRLDQSGKRRKLRPLIMVETADPVLAEVGTAMTAVTRPGQSAQIMSVSADSGDAMSAESSPENGPENDTESGGMVRVVLELSGGMGRSLTAAPGSVPEVGEWLCYSALTADYQRPWEFPPTEETPWTHGGPPQPYVPADEDAVEEWS
jgi:hypothetical protein